MTQTESHQQPEPGPEIRVLLTKVGLDPHDRGIKILATRLEEAGMEVVYTGAWQSKDAAVSAIVQEDPDVVGFNAYSGDHLIIPKVLRRLGKYDVLEELLVIVGGNVPEEDYDALYDAGVTKIFPQDTSSEDVITYLTKNVKEIENLPEGD
jgi:methylmalonyl-CoA mutase C-terminal domain/subunit